MEAIEIEGLTKSFNGLHALDGLSMHVPVGSIYGFIGENGSGKSTTMKLICGHLVPTKGKIKLFGKNYKDAGIRSRVGALIENAGCFPNSSIYQNLLMQTINLGIENRDEEIDRVLKIVRMEEHKNLKFSKCSLGMKQRVGIAMALLGNPALLILDEPINGLDADGMKLMREILVDIVNTCGCTVLISSHILGELEKIATNYGIICQGRMIEEISAEDLEKSSKVYVSVKTKDLNTTFNILKEQFEKVEREEDSIRVFDIEDSERITDCLEKGNQEILEIVKNKIGLEEYYINKMSRKEKK